MPTENELTDLRVILAQAQLHFVSLLLEYYRVGDVTDWLRTEQSRLNRIVVAAYKAQTERTEQLSLFGEEATHAA